MDDHSEDLKPKAEVEYLENGMSPEQIEFKKREKKLVKKLDMFVAPVMMMLMLISYLDRGNIGFAATQGMADDIGLVGSQLNVRIRQQAASATAYRESRLPSPYFTSSISSLK